MSSEGDTSAEGMRGRRGGTGGAGGLLVAGARQVSFVPASGLLPRPLRSSKRARAEMKNGSSSER